MEREVFYRNNKMTANLEFFIESCSTFHEFEKMYSEEFLNEDSRIGDYLENLVWKSGKAVSKVSFDAHLNSSYVGNIINGKKNNPSRDALINIGFAVGTTIEEMQYLLKYSGHAPLYVRRKRDVIIWFGIMKKETIEVVNDNLLDRGLKPLYRE